MLAGIIFAMGTSYLVGIGLPDNILAISLNAIIILIVGGSIVLFGSGLYAKDKSMSGIFILIGAILGGLNPISLLGGIIALIDGNNLKKIQNKEKKAASIRKAEKIVYDYFVENEGKAFSAVALHKRCIENNLPNLLVTEIEQILQNLNYNGKIGINTKENISYFSKSLIFFCLV